MSVFPKHISSSGIDIFLTCNLMFKLIYIDKIEREPGNIYTAFGSAIHRTLAYNYTQKITSKVDLPIRECETKFVEFLVDELNNLPGKTDSNTFDMLGLQGQEIISRYMKEISPKIQPAEVEQKFELELKSAGVTILGYVDLVTDDDIVIDHKTAGSSTRQKRTQNYVNNLNQLTVYSLAFRKKNNRKEKGLRIDVLKRLKGGVGIVTLNTQRTDEEIIVLVQLLGNMRKIVEQDLFYPNLSNCPGCPYKNKCNKMCKVI